MTKRTEKSLYQKALSMHRHRLGANQEQIAKALGISIPAYSKLETGTTDMNLSRLIQIAGHYQVPAPELLAEMLGTTVKPVVNSQDQLDAEILYLRQQLNKVQGKLIAALEQLIPVS